MNDHCRIGGAFVLTIALASLARAQDPGDAPADVVKTQEGVTVAQGGRLFQALTHGASAKQDDQGVSVKFGWTVTGQQKTGTGWRVRGNMTGAYQVTDSASHKPVVGWVVNV